MEIRVPTTNLTVQNVTHTAQFCKRKILSMFAYLATCYRVSQERRALAELSEHELKDIGLEPADVKREAQRDFFDVPPRRFL